MNRELPRKYTIMLIIAAAAFIVFGVYRGEVITVLGKATRICMECIGIG